MFDEKITLDKETFKVLSSDTRIRILKLLGKRRMTLSEVSACLEMSVSAVKEHLGTLVSAELIQQMDEGHKWKYYQLTGRGREIVAPAEKRVMIVLGLSAVALITSLYTLAGNIVQQPVMFAARTPDAGAVLKEATQEAVPLAAPASAFPLVPFLLAASLISVLVAGFCVGYLHRSKKQMG